MGLMQSAHSLLLSMDASVLLDAAEHMLCICAQNTNAVLLVKASCLMCCLRSRTTEFSCCSSKATAHFC